jgi:hypothetical protein
MIIEINLILHEHEQCSYAIDTLSNGASWHRIHLDKHIHFLDADEVKYGLADVITRLFFSFPLFCSKYPYSPLSHRI